MTEEEAKKLWCPFARQFHQSRSMTDDVLIANRTETSAPIGTCLASGCMAWRWHGYAGEEIALDRDHPFHRFPRDEHDQRHGHCGLAGKDGAS